jgi:lycopene cyclase domain-containing protein
MTYWDFHLVFILPVIGLLALLAWRANAVPRRGLWWLAGMSIIALIYTTPWDNYLVAQGVWSYNPDRVQATIGWVPVEEYFFFLVQPVLTGLWLFLVLSRRPPASDRPSRWLPPVILAGVALLALVGVSLLFTEKGFYLGLILAWTAPVLALQLYVGRSTLWTHRHILLWAVAVPTLYLWVCDRLAIGLGIWNISERFTTGIALIGLPIEEAVFFLITNLMVVQGLLLLRNAARRPVERPPSPATVA